MCRVRDSQRRDRPTYWLSGYPTSMSYFILCPGAANRAWDLYKIAGRVEDRAWASQVL